MNKQKIIIILLVAIIIIAGVYLYNRRFFLNNECIKSESQGCNINQGCNKNDGEKILLYGSGYECTCYNACLHCAPGSLCDCSAAWNCIKK
jgi:uncharacterized protein YxeA